MTKTLCAVVLLLALVGIVPTIVPARAPAPAPVPMSGAMVPVPPAHCPRIHEAAGALEAAIHDLESAGHDFCGHKKDALEASHRALEQLRRAEDCDRCR